MKRDQIYNILILSAITILTLLYLLGVPEVPFHPDESTNLYMSQDFDTLLTHPAQLFWQSGNENDLRQRYRELDPPLSRYIIGIGRHIAGLPALPVDWNWSKTWEENQAAGALPGNDLLLAGRLSVAVFFPLTLYLIFSIGKSLGGQLTAWLAFFLFASNALILLHTRRAMSESLLLMTIALSLWSMLRFRKRPWLVAITVALAFCAKPTSAPLIILGIFSILWPIPGIIRPKRVILRDLALYILIFAAVTFLLNPFLWSDPIHAAWGALNNRQMLMERQVVALQAVRPDQVLDTIPNKIIGMIAQLFLTQPTIADIGNYVNQTQPAETAYFANPLNHLFRNLYIGGFLWILSMVGFLYGCLKAWRSTVNNKRTIGLILLGTIFQCVALIAVLRISWQRYYLPMIPYTCLWIAFTITEVKNQVTRQAGNKA